MTMRPGTSRVSVDGVRPASSRSRSRVALAILRVDQPVGSWELPLVAPPNRLLRERSESVAGFVELAPFLPCSMEWTFS